MCVAIAQQDQQLQTTEYEEGEEGFSGLRAISVSLDEPTFLPSPEKNCDFKNNREYVELLFLMPFNKIQKEMQPELMVIT